MIFKIEAKTSKKQIEKKWRKKIMKKVTFTVRILTIMVQMRGGKLRSGAPDEQSKDLKNEALA